jgi:hypothetical protein
MRGALACQVVVGEGVLVGAVGGTTVGAGAGDVAWVVGLAGAVVGAPVGLGPMGAVVIVESWLGDEVVDRGVGARVAGVWTRGVLTGGVVAAGSGRTQR